MLDLTGRSLLPEKMDQASVDENEIHQALRELEVINNLLGGHTIIINALNKVNWPNDAVTILDLGCGGGDTLRIIAKWADRKNLKVNLIGVDWNPIMTSYAAEKSRDYANISFRTTSVFDDDLMLEKADIIINSQFCHHFEDKKLVELVKQMYKLSSQAIIINDLHRHWFAYHAIRALTFIFSKTHLVKYDGPLSVAKSLKRKEWLEVLNSAGIKNYQLKWMWAWRWQIIISKP